MVDGEIFFKVYPIVYFFLFITIVNIFLGISDVIFYKKLEKKDKKSYKEDIRFWYGWSAVCFMLTIYLAY